MNATVQKETASANPEPSLVEKLRAMVPLCEDEANYPDDDRALLSAASRIEALEAENDDFRQTLNGIANYAPECTHGWAVAVRNTAGNALRRNSHD